MSKRKRLFGILLALPPLLLGLLYGGGYIAQFMHNYHDEYTTSENIAHSVRFLPQCRPVITSVANLYLRKQIIFERM